MTARTGSEGLKLALKQKPDLVVLDIMLPEKDGFTVLKELRQRHREMPVLVITARNFEADVLKGFDLGADDYLTKPFGVKELLARAKRLIQRGPTAGQTPGPTTYTFGDVEIRFEPREVLKTGKQVALSFKEFELLKYMIEHRGRTVSREELLEEIWGVDEDLGVTTRTVDTHVSNLRSKLGAGFAQPFIVAVHKVGYKFVEPAGTQAKA
jgi:DNA-binding response OmpR family regulator